MNYTDKAEVQTDWYGGIQRAIEAARMDVPTMTVIHALYEEIARINGHPDKISPSSGCQEQGENGQYREKQNYGVGTLMGAAIRG